MTFRSSLSYREALRAQQHWMNELCHVRDGMASGNSPLHSFHVNADIYGEQRLVLCQAHFQELVISQLLHRLVLHVFKGIGIVGFINILGKRRESEYTQGIHEERPFCMPQQTMVFIQYPLSPTPASLHFLPQQDTVELLPSPRETEIVPIIEGNISSGKMLRLKMQHVAELGSTTQLGAALRFIQSCHRHGRTSICVLFRSFPEFSHGVRAPFLTFFPFLVGEMLILARSWKVCLRTCLTKGSLAICKATMYRAPSSTASGLGN